MKVKLALPSKGRLKEATISWFAARGIEIVPSENEREYAASAPGFENLEIVLMSAGEIPAALASGSIHMGVTGLDMVAEKIGAWQERIDSVFPMGFGHADLVLAVPMSWIDVEDLRDLDALCAHFRGTQAKRLRIATKYHRLVRDYLRENDVTNFQLVDSQGATEGVVANDYAEMIADITSSGATLSANYLKILGDPILRSEAHLFAITSEFLTPDLEANLRSLCATLSKA